jgi:hypothetical protein
MGVRFYLDLYNHTREKAQPPTGYRDCDPEFDRSIFCAEQSCGQHRLYCGLCVLWLSGRCFTLITRE